LSEEVATGPAWSMRALSIRPGAAQAAGASWGWASW